jgi:Omp85 superfamily domain
MTYHRQAIVNRRDIQPKAAPHATHFDRIVAASSLGANILFGIATVTLTVLALNFNQEFNVWQKQQANQQDINAQKQACIQIAFQALNQIRTNERSLVEDAINAISEIDPRCRKIGISASRITNAIIIKNSEKFSQSVVREAKIRIGKNLNNPKITLNNKNVNSVLSETASDLRKSVPRVQMGVGVDLESPFGPFRIDLSRALVKEKGDEVKNFDFNPATAF